MVIDVGRNEGHRFYMWSVSENGAKVLRTEDGYVCYALEDHWGFLCLTLKGATRRALRVRKRLERRKAKKSKREPVHLRFVSDTVDNT